jgi:hypothetical protein
MAQGQMVFAPFYVTDAKFSHNMPVVRSRRIAVIVCGAIDRFGSAICMTNIGIFDVEMLGRANGHSPRRAAVQSTIAQTFPQ